MLLSLIFKTDHDHAIIIGVTDTESKIYVKEKGNKDELLTIS